jgi:hypothetical protein
MSPRWWNEPTVNKAKASRRTDPGVAKPRRAPRRSLLAELLEDRTLPSVYTDMAGLVDNLKAVEQNLESAADLVQHVPFLDQAKQQLGDLLHNAQDPLIISTELLDALKKALNNNSTDQAVAGAIAAFKPPVTQATVDSTPDANGEHIEIDLVLHQDLLKLSNPINLSFGLPGLPVKVDGTGGVTVSVGYDAALAFGLTTQNGKPVFFWKGATIPKTNDQFTVDVKANMQGASLDATVGLLKGTLADDPSKPSSLDVAFHLAPFNDFNIIPTPTVTLNQAHIGLVASLSFDPTTQMNSWFPQATTVQLPSLKAGLAVDWTNSFDPSNLSVSFNDVKLDLGSALGSFIKPVVTVVQDVFGPIEPIINLLTTPIPGLSDLSHLIGQGDVTLLGIAGEVASAVVGPEIAPITSLVGDLLPIIKDINNIQGQEVDLGTFDLSGQQDQLANGSVNFDGLTDTTNLANLTSLVPKVVGQLPDILGQLDPNLNKQIVQVLGDLQNLINPAGADFEFPILNDPVHSAFQLLLGQDADLFVFKAHFDVPPVGESTLIPDLGFTGVDLKLDDGMEFAGSFKLAYDTFGIREYFHDLFNQQNPQNKPKDLLDGFYVDNANTYLRFQGKLGFGPEVSPFPGVFVQLSGGLNTGNDGADPFTISLDGAGPKLRLTSLFTQNCLFDAQGELDAGVGVTVKVGFDGGPLGFVGVEHDFNIATVVLESYPQPTCLGDVSQENISLGTVQNGTLVLNLAGADVAGYLKKYGQKAETFEVKHETDPNDPNSSVRGNEDLSVTVLGITQHFNGVHDILADGSTVSLDQNVTVDPGVLDDATLIGGPGTNTLTYLGSGDAHLRGGFTPGETSQLTGGTGNNYLQGGAGTDVLIGGQSAPGKFNTLTAGGGDDQLYAGPTSDDVLTGGAGDDVFYAGGGHDTMTGGTQSNVFNWTEGDGQLDVTGGGGVNTLSAVGTKKGDQFTASQDQGGGLVVQAPGATLHATGIEKLNLDGVAGLSRYFVNDLSRTPVQRVGLNLHEESSTDGAADEVNVYAPPFNDSVEIYWDEQLAAQGKQVTQVFVSTHLGDGTLAGGATASYQISASIPKKADVLRVNTLGGADVVRVDSTQPDLTGVGTGGHDMVNTGDGDDQITVGSPSVGLDDFFGPLDVDAGGGHNRITFDESASLVHDVVTMTASQVIRSKQTAPVTVPPSPGGVGHTEIGYPFVISYDATNGDFAPVNGDPGVIFKTAHGSTTLYVPETGAAAPTEVICGGGLINSHDVVAVGYDGQGRTPFPKTAALSTLDSLRSVLTAHGTGGIPPASVLDLDDAGAPVGETYVLDAAPSNVGVLGRSGAATVFFDHLAMTLNAGGMGNQIYVPGVARFTAATVNAGNGNDTVNVGEPPLASPPVGRLDAIAGPLTINGGPGVNDLSINDQGTTTAQQYFLGAHQLTRNGNQAVVVNFSHVADLTLNASNNAGGTDLVLVNGTPAGVPARVELPGAGDALLVVEDLDQILGPLTFDWTSGKKDVVVNDGASVAGSVYRIDSTPAVTTLHRSKAAPVTWNGFLTTAALLPGLAHTNTVRVDSVGAGTTLTVDAGLAADDVVVGRPTQDLDAVRGSLVVHGNGATRLTLDDRKAPAGRDYQLTVSATAFDPNLPVIQFTSLALLTLDAGPSAKVEILASAKGTDAQVNVGGGKNRVVVGSANDTLATIQGAISVIGQTGNDALGLNDQNGPFMSSYTLTGSSIASASSAAVTFQNVGGVTLNGGPGVESYSVQGVGGTPIVVTGQGVDNVLFGPDRANLWAITAADAGVLDGVIAFTGVQSLIGGSVGDTFTFAQSASLSGSVASHAPRSLATVAGFNQSDMTVRADVDLGQGQSVTLLTRYDAATDSWYGAELVGTASGFVPVIYRRQNGVVTVLATGAPIASASGTLAFTVLGTSLTLSLNNVALVNAADAALTSGGAGALFGDGVSIRDFGVS